MARFTIDIRNNGLTNTELMVKVSDALTALKNREDNEPNTLNTDLFINGEEFMFTHNSKMQWEGISKI